MEHVSGEARDRVIDYASPALLGARVVAVVGAGIAVAGLCLPWARQLDVYQDLEHNRPTLSENLWTGWTLAGESHLDGEVLVPMGWAVTLVVATLVVAAACLAAWEASRNRFLPAATALVSLVCSYFGGLATGAGRHLLHHHGTVEGGGTVWRTGLLLVLLGTARAAWLLTPPRPPVLPERI